MPLAEGGARTRVSVMRTTVLSAAAARQSGPVDISPPVASVAASPVFGMTILQRHLAMSQSGQQGAVLSGRSMPALPLLLQRSPLAPVASDAVGRTGPLPAGVLPLARSVDQHAALSGYDRRPSSLSPLPTAHSHCPLRNADAAGATFRQWPGDICPKADRTASGQQCAGSNHELAAIRQYIHAKRHSVNDCCKQPEPDG